MATSTLTVEQKLLEISKQIHNIEKDSYNSFHKYEYVSANKLFEKIKPLLCEQGLILLPSCKSISEKDGLTTIEMLYKIVDTETAEFQEFIIPGQGTDKGDKGAYKAMTGALKYLWLQLFMISTDDDPETDGEPRQERKKETSIRKPPESRAEKPAPKSSNVKTQSDEELNPWIWQIENTENIYCGKYLFEIPLDELPQLLLETDLMSADDDLYARKALKQKKQREIAIQLWRKDEREQPVFDPREQKPVIKQDFDQDSIPY